MLWVGFATIRTGVMHKADVTEIKVFCSVLAAMPTNMFGWITIRVFNIGRPFQLLCTTESGRANNKWGTTHSYTFENKWDSLGLQMTELSFILLGDHTFFQ